MPLSLLMTPALLVTGMSGTGKSAVLAELARRGHRVVDTDEPGWSTDVPTVDGSVERLWVEESMTALLDGDQQRPHEPSSCLFVSGCVRNQGRFADRFDAVILLTAPVEIMLARIASRTRNRFGKAPEERERILRDRDEVEPVLRASATVVLDTNRPLTAVVDDVEAVARRRAP